MGTRSERLAGFGDRGDPIRRYRFRCARAGSHCRDMRAPLTTATEPIAPEPTAGNEPTVSSDPITATRDPFERPGGKEADADDAVPEFIRDLDIRRAILAVLLGAERELSSDDVVIRLRAAHGIDLTGRQKVSPRQRVSDTLRSLERRGWCRRVRRGRYVAVPSAMSPSRRWRSLNWRRPSVRSPRR